MHHICFKRANNWTSHPFLSLFHFNRHNIRLNHRCVEKLLINLINRISVRTPQIIRVSNSLVHFQTIYSCHGHIIYKHRLPRCILPFDSVQGSIEHDHVVLPSPVNLFCKVQSVVHPGWPENSHIRESLFYLLFSDPFGS